MKRADFLKRVFGGAAVVVASPSVLVEVLEPEDAFDVVSGANYYQISTKNLIYDVSPRDTPFMSALTTGRQVELDWTKDALRPRYDA